MRIQQIYEYAERNSNKKKTHEAKFLIGERSPKVVKSGEEGGDRGCVLRVAFLLKKKRHSENIAENWGVFNSMEGCASPKT